MGWPTAEHLVQVAPVHADEVDSAVARYLGRGAKRFGQERAELVVGHFARGHGELAVAALRIGVTVDLHIVRRVEERGIDRCTLAD